MAFDNFSRRDFIKTIAFLLAGQNYSSIDVLAQNQAQYKIAPWTGDDFTHGHQLRDGIIPVSKIESQQSTDIAIIGGGMAGLASAYYLRDHNFILLEQYGELGGQSRGRNFNRLDYSFGPAYVDSKEGLLGEIFDNLNITPATIQASSKHSWYWEKQWFPGVEANKQDVLHKNLEKFLAECKPIWKQLPNDGSYISDLTDKVADFKQLDSTPFRSYLQGYDPAFIGFIDDYCKSICLEDTNRLSALAGFAIAQDLIMPAYVFKGGNAAIAKALANKINDTGNKRCLTNTFVWKVEAKENIINIIYSKADGTMHEIRCKKAIITAPPLVSTRIITNLPDQIKANLLSFKFGSYLVANLCFNKIVFDGAYDNWVGNQNIFSFTDIVRADAPYQSLGNYSSSMGQVLTLYQPYTPESGGRSILYAGNREKMASSLVDQLSQVISSHKNYLEEVVLTRWGHAMVVPRPNFFSQLNKLHHLDTSPIYLAHNSMAGLPSAESAVGAAKRACTKLLA